MDNFWPGLKKHYVSRPRRTNKQIKPNYKGQITTFISEHILKKGDQ